MEKLYFKMFGLVFFILSFQTAIAQPSNDNCTTPINLTNLTNWCSNVGQYTTVGAGNPSGYTEAGCQAIGVTDVWFSFTAIATDLSVSVIGNASGGTPGGTLTSPEIMIYDGVCGGNILELECGSDVSNNNIIDVYQGGLTPGQTYLIRIDSRNTTQGTFQLCINNYNPPADPESDCPTAAVLCDKSSFTIQSVVGAGLDNTEMDDAVCFGGGTGLETNSSWYVFTAATTGSLTFDLIPTNPNDDLDFIIYELPNGVGNCAGKIVLRCMASGATLSTSVCMGATGLEAGSTDTSEDSGCNDTFCGGIFPPCDDNYLAPLNMIAGTTYALGINNFTSTGSGFTLNFGGTGEFLGPVADFIPSSTTICEGDNLILTDNSNFALGTIVNWSWNFGVDASPPSANTVGPHSVSYSSPGPKIVTLTVTSDEGCQVTTNQTITVQDCCAAFDATISSFSDPSCGQNNGTISVSTMAGTPPFTYNWNPSISTTATANNLGQGLYSITVTDAIGCIDIIAQNLTNSGSPTITGITAVDPSCMINNGSITIAVSGGTPSYQYNINGGTFQASNVFSGLGQGIYQVIVQDNNNCQDTVSVQLNELNGPSIISVSTFDEICEGDNGMLIINVNGGALPYQYSINNGTTFLGTDLFAGLEANTYNIIVQDANGCQVSSQATINNQPGPSITNVAITDATCGQNNGSLVISVNSGMAPYQYSINNGATFQGSNTYTNLMPGIYDIIVMDTLGCTVSTQETLNTTNGVMINSLSSTDPSCGNTNGSITVNASGGLMPITYSIDNGVTFQTSNMFNGLSQGTFNIITQDADSCQDSGQIILSNLQAPSITNINTVNTACNGSTGSVEVIATGGTPPLQYSSNNGLSFQASNLFPNLGSGTYLIVVQDAVGCTVNSSATITDNGSPTIGNINVINPLCGGNDGSISILASGGTNPLQYSIDDGVTFTANTSYNNLPAATYDIVVIDDSGCSVSTQVVLFDEPGSSITSVSATHPSCGENNGILIININGGTPPVQYSIDGGSTYQSGNTFINLPAGNYPIMIIDLNGCTDSNSAILNPSTAPVINNFINTPTSCNSNNGSLQILAGNGTFPLEYSINNGISFQSSNSFTNLAAGTYFIAVQDANGCVVNDQVTIAPSTSVEVSALTPSHPTCGNADGSITITATNGTAPYQYSLDNVLYQSSNIFDNLLPGTHTIYVTDAAGCSYIGSINLNQSTTVVIDNINTINGNCGQPTGLIDIDASGGVLNYQYSINNGTSFQPSSVFPNLVSGTYDIVVQDAVGCTVSGQTSLFNASAAVIDQVLATNPSTCGGDDGEITILFSGGVLPMQFSINNGMTYTSSNTFSGLLANTYNVVIQDALGCIDTTIVVLTDPTSPTIDSIESINPNCGLEDGSITISVSGGNPNFEYSIDGGITYQGMNSFDSLPAGNYIITVLDFLGCQTSTVPITLFDNGAPNIDNTFVTNTSCSEINGIISINASGGTWPYQYSIDGGTTYQSSTTFADLPPGTYDVFVMDDEGCTGSDQVVLADDGDVQIDNVQLQDPSSCSATDGAINIIASGGTAPYQFSTNNGMSFQNSGMYTGLSANTYNIVVTDANGCIRTQIVNLNGLTPPVIDAVNQLDPNCGLSNGSIEILTSGGTPNYQYSIDGGASFQGSNIFNGLNAGTYSVVVADANNCITTEIVFLNNFGAPVLDNIITNNPECGISAGTIEIYASGGITPYQYSIDNGTTFQPANYFSNLGAGTYIIVVQDGALCQVTSQVTLTDLGGLVLNNTITAAPTCNDNDGSIELIVGGGDTPYQYSIDNGMNYQPSSQFTGLPAGLYNIVVEDANGCILQDVVTLTSIGNPEITSVDIQNADCSLPDGNLVINTIGGTPPLQYSIDNGISYIGTNTFNALPPGEYDIVVTDFNSCSSSTTAIINSSQIPTVNILTDGPTDICYGGVVQLNAGLFDAYQWSNGEMTQVIQVSASGLYEVTVTDSNGCNGQGSLNVNVANPIPVEAVEITELEVSQLDTISVLFPDPNITYTWEGSDGSMYSGPSFEFMTNEEGTYVFIVTAQVGDCFATDTLTFDVINNNVWDIPNAFTPNNDGLNDTFEPLIHGTLKIVEFRVYNRWGEKVHDDSNSGWDGTFRNKEQDVGVFVYTVIIETIDGQQESKSGDVHLLR